MDDTRYRSYYEYSLILLAGILVFRPVATYAIIVFIFLHLIVFRRLNYDRKKWLSIALISSPLLLDLLFLWNNDSIIEGVKNGEKHLTTFIFPFLILGQVFLLNLKRLLKGYSVVFTTILLIGLIRYILISGQKVSDYFSGIEVWKMGYDFAISMDLHAPALNMHIAFLVIVNFYLLVNGYLRNVLKKEQYLHFLFLVISIILLFVVNTRMALINVVLGLIMIVFWEFYRTKFRKKLVKLSAGILVVITLMAGVFISAFPYVVSKYSEITFKHMDKIGRLDEIENPEAEVYNALVTRVSIWKTSWELSKQHLLIGVGAADARDELVRKFAETDQQFLYRHKFTPHNQYLDFLLKYGFLGLASTLIFVIKPIWIGVRRNLSISAFIALLFFTSNITDDFLARFDGITFYAFWLSVFTNQYLNGRSNSMSVKSQDLN